MLEVGDVAAEMLATGERDEQDIASQEDEELV